MAAKKTKTTKSTKQHFLKKELHPDTESVAVGSAFSLFFALILKSLVLAIPLGLAFALAHRHGLKKKKN